jgi:curved DNA-binding protein CbpA
MFDKYYTILELNNQATDDEVKRAYKRLAIKHHPDKNPDTKEISEEKFKDIAQAYEILSNKDKYQHDRGFRQNNMPQVDPNKLFAQLFAQMNIHPGMQVNPAMFMHQAVGSQFIQIPPNTVMRSTSTRIENGKKIMTITEQINGRTRIQTIVSNISQPTNMNID